MHTILADGVWTPSRARKRAKRESDRCILCGKKSADADHLWWDCPCLHSRYKFHFADLKIRRARDKGQPRCLWTIGVVPKGFTELPESEPMRAEIRNYEGPTDVGEVYIDGFAYEVGSSKHAGWGIWARGKPAFSDSGPVEGSRQPLPGQRSGPFMEF